MKSNTHSKEVGYWLAKLPPETHLSKLSDTHYTVGWNAPKNYPVKENTTLQLGINDTFVRPEDALAKLYNSLIKAGVLDQTND